MTDLESPKKNNDCYFYYYSTCAKGNSCTFRHEPSALGCETMCSFWKEGKCLNVHCNFRHMELRKNRKAIPCYWESQPMGCLKAHCPFMHTNPRPSDAESSPGKTVTSDKSSSDNRMNQQSERKVTAVDKLVVNFEEESDNESAPTFSPNKCGNRIVKVKTLEEIRLEKIQAESAAFYSVYNDEQQMLYTENEDDLRERIVRRIPLKSFSPERKVTFSRAINKRLSNNELATILGDESLRKKQKMNRSHSDPDLYVQQRQHTSQDDGKNVEEIKVKTLAEIRAEKSKAITSTFDSKIMEEKEEAVVTSTSSEVSTFKRRKLKLRRKLPSISRNTVTPTSTSENIHRGNTDVEITNKISEGKSTMSEDEEMSLLDNEKKSDRSETAKSIEDVLLLEADDDDFDNVTLRAEEDLLNDIDDLL